jgi:RNA polymerase sigma factor (sigma-70 family)
MADLHTFQAQRPRLFSMAYRMLGSASEAEDVLQDAWVRFEGAGNEDVRSPQAFLATVVSRLCLDRLKSARHKRETYVGPWLPEPVLTLADEEGPDVLAERSESVTLAFLVLLEALSAEERAVFLLKEVFDYEHADIAEILGISPANSRQLFHRAKSKLRRGVAANIPSLDGRDGGTARPSRDAGGPSREARLAIANRFAQAFRSGNAAEFTQLLARDVGFVADGGGKVAAARRPLLGREEVTRFLVGLNRSARALGLAARATLRVTEVNSEPAMVIHVDGQIDGVFVLSIAEGAVVNIRVVRNPDKLAYLDRQLRSVM